MRTGFCLAILVAVGCVRAFAGPITSGGGETTSDPAHLILPDVECEGGGHTFSVFGLYNDTATVMLDGYPWSDVPVAKHIVNSGPDHGMGCGGDCTEEDFDLRWGGPSGSELTLKFSAGLKNVEGFYDQNSGSDGKSDLELRCERVVGD